MSESSREYPDAIDKWWLSRACKDLNTEDVNRALTLLRAPIQSLSDQFTKKREDGFIEYFKGGTNTCAYGLFYFPQTWMLTRLVLSELLEFRNWRLPNNGPINILDLGCGLGSAGLSALELLHRKGVDNPISLHGVDYATRALSYCSDIFHQNSQLWPNAKLSVNCQNLNDFQRDKKGPAKGYHLIILSFSLNEALQTYSTEKVIGYLRSLSSKLSRGGLIVVMDPAMKPISEALHSAAESLTEDRKLFYWGPYLHGPKCPLVETKKYWNHEVRLWNPPQSLSFLNRKLWRSIQELKCSCLILGKAPSESSDNDSDSLVRLVSPIVNKKGRFVFFAVDESGVLGTYDIQFRDINKDEKKKVEMIERGDTLGLNGLIKLGGDAQYRIPEFSKIVFHYQP